MRPSSSKALHHAPCSFFAIWGTSTRWVLQGSSGIQRRSVVSSTAERFLDLGGTVSGFGRCVQQARRMMQDCCRSRNPSIRDQILKTPHNLNPYIFRKGQHSVSIEAESSCTHLHAPITETFVNPVNPVRIDSQSPTILHPLALQSSAEIRQRRNETGL